MKIIVLLFGVLAEKAGAQRLELENIEDLESLKDYFNVKYPEFKELSFRVSVNQELVCGNIKLSDGDELALLPPFAGG
ncbi:MAG: MoaD/ThiS family protein [Marinilabiliaceae bacterium]|jgi:molybdopterin converting factor small subunit|nr:MoaD/ThiS family protein [Marinilabiliaceae bacterium]